MSLLGKLRIAVDREIVATETVRSVSSLKLCTNKEVCVEWSRN